MSHVNGQISLLLVIVHVPNIAATHPKLFNFDADQPIGLPHSDSYMYMSPFNVPKTRNNAFCHCSAKWKENFMCNKNTLSVVEYTQQNCYFTPVMFQDFSNKLKAMYCY